MTKLALLISLLCLAVGSAQMVSFGNYYDANCTELFATAELNTSMSCSGGCYTDKQNLTFCNTGSGFRCLPDRIEYTQHVQSKDCGGDHAVNVTVHTTCMPGRSHQGTIYNMMLNYTGC
eukprot:TRINITY_DN4738_c0_g1_i2.p2 TRINITY_DN4738_c0_g1~~TRINITY_DN4738_c0_g1_i2.p2  ORF type:complete len:119 (-),score=33.38 TRINITY_DN4738_c0_g1_i2:119-475(-)